MTLGEFYCPYMVNVFWSYSILISYLQIMYKKLKVFSLCSLWLAFLYCKVCNSYGQFRHNKFQAYGCIFMASDCITLHTLSNQSVLEQLIEPLYVLWNVVAHHCGYKKCIIGPCSNLLSPGHIFAVYSSLVLVNITVPFMPMSPR